MTDYKEEQRNEIEALESIYPSEMKVLTVDPEFSFTVDIRTEPLRNSSDEEYMFVALKFEYVPNYPDEAPLMEVEESENMSDDDITDLLAFLQNRVEDNLGMVMVFTLVSEASEWLNTRLVDSITQRKDAEEQRIRRLEEEERQRFEGVRVTVESFMNWKFKFDQEMAELKKLQKEEIVSKKLTGRELFEKDQTLVDSDLQFLQEGDEEVKVDESLFQELDDLELEDEDLSS
ncbi:RWD domain-containing protein 1 [Parasteatoda tepidariorum]|uniref:RWD domain-containing protein 1 n=1 Tax=Parasteatoda tepidariorum TaxID=114398 RepID=UPI00077FD2B1|nr:RWD domain-containing protein 1 [Parasteatoda tepidariorum]